MIRTITDKQAAFLKRLHDERGIAFDSEAVGALTAREASEAIDAILALPRPARPAAAKAEPGFYVQADGTAIRVVLTKDKQRTYAKRFVVAGGGASWEYAPGVAATLAGLVPKTGPQAAALGIQSGHCIRCTAALGGESLSARCSAIVGYGETCARREGWDFPKGVAAQRAVIAAHAPALAA